jgi:hypothetical protein
MLLVHHVDLFLENGQVNGFTRTQNTMKFSDRQDLLLNTSSMPRIRRVLV